MGVFLATSKLYAHTSSGDDTVALVKLDKTEPDVTIAAPDWTHLLGEIDYEVTQIKRRMHELEELQDKHSTRPDVFDDVEEEHNIDILTAEISQLTISTNEPTRMKGREERVIAGELRPTIDTNGRGGGGGMQFDDEEEIEVLVDKGFTSGQLSQLEDNSELIEQREREI
uniref:Uncharacterized protein n=1 Tax=Amphimedon queenslandica TaxID=400682 RepID=A0A1X7T623_AMPQE